MRPDVLTGLEDDDEDDDDEREEAPLVFVVGPLRDSGLPGAPRRLPVVRDVVTRTVCC